MAEGISLSELGRRLGRAKSGLSVLAKAKRIPQLPDGSFDQAAVEKTLVADIDPARRKPQHDAVQRSSGSERSERSERTRVVRDKDDAAAAIALIARVLREEGVEADGAVDYNAARTAETILKARERDLKIAQRRKELVPLAEVKKHVERGFVGIRQAFQRLPSRHAPAMAAELGVDPADLDRVLSAAIATELDDLSAPVVRV